MSQVYFTADEHYGHSNILKYCNRPFSNTEEMKETIIKNHNSVVKPGDRTFHIGDMFWRTLSLKDALDIRYRLNGEHYYILGNHEERMRDKTLQDSFVWVRDVYNLNVQGYPNIFLLHYACRVWNGSHKKAWHLYGHSHSNLPERTRATCGDESPYSFDVGVDALLFFPISLEEVKLRMEQKGWNK